MSGVAFDEIGEKAKAASKADSKAPKWAIYQNVVKPARAAASALNKAAASPLAWTVITCTLLAISTGERYWRDGDLWGKVATASASPFPLAELPKEIGSWQMVEGSEAVLDPDIAYAAGANSHLLRNYVDSNSGESVNVLILYGLARNMIGHSPDYCYPYSGFEKVDTMGTYELELDGLKNAVRYRGGSFTKSSLGTTQFVQVIYSLRSGDRWLADGATLWTRIRTEPGMYKIQIAGPAPVNLAVDTSPSVDLLGRLVTEVERRLSQASAKSGKAVATVQATPK
jgi:hypothetical protein